MAKSEAVAFRGPVFRSSRAMAPADLRAEPQANRSFSADTSPSANRSAVLTALRV
jgi:hypothetical protein